MLATIHTLRDISHRCLTDQPLDEDVRRWLGASLRTFLEHRSSSVDEAMGLRFPQGGVPWWREEAIRKRDAALRELASGFFAGIRPATQARRIALIALRYAGSAWRYDQLLDAPPPSAAGTPKEHLWRAFKSGAAMPICERQLRKILAR